MNLTVEEFVLSNRGIIQKLANKYLNTDYGIEFDDLFQVGCLQLLENYHKYDSNKGSISTFAYKIAQYAMLDYIRDNIAIPHISKELISTSSRFMRDNLSFYKENGRQMTDEEAIIWIKKHINNSYYSDINKYLAKLKYIIYYHLNNKYHSVEYEKEKFEYNTTLNDDDNSISLVEKMLISDSNVEEEVINKINIEEFIENLIYLTPIQRDTFLEIEGLQDGIPKTYKDLASKYGVTASAVNSNYHKALIKIRERNSKKNLI